jgi:pyroglutamyl-peptidase
MTATILLTGFMPFGGERINPSWQVAAKFDRATIGGATVRAWELPVNLKRAGQALAGALQMARPDAILGLGQAGGRTALSIEQVAINLVDERRTREAGGAIGGKPIVAGGPDAYFTRLPAAAILRALARNEIPAERSLSAGIFICNAAMYLALHATRDRPAMPVGFIHLPYAASQAARHRAAPSMSLEMMTAGVAIALGAIARTLARPRGEAAT